MVVFKVDVFILIFILSNLYLHQEIINYLNFHYANSYFNIFYEYINAIYL